MRSLSVTASAIFIIIGLQSLLAFAMPLKSDTASKNQKSIVIKRSCSRPIQTENVQSPHGGDYVTTN